MFYKKLIILLFYNNILLMSIDLKELNKQIKFIEDLYSLSFHDEIYSSIDDKKKILDIFNGLYVDGMYNIKGLYHECVLRDYEKAHEFYKIDADKGNVDAMNNLGSLLEAEGNIKEAIKYYEIAVEKGDEDAPNYLGNLYENENMIKKAIKYYKIAVDNYYVQRNNNIGRLLEKLGKEDEAIKFYKVAYENNYSENAYNLGCLMQKRWGK